MRKKKSRSRRRVSSILAILTVSLGLVYYATADRLSPEQALTELVVSKVEPTRARELAAIAGKRPHLAGWAGVQLARMLESEPDQAIAVLKKLELKSDAAWTTEARLMLQRLLLEQGKDSPTGFSPSELKSFSIRYRRKELELESLYTLALLQLRNREDALKTFEEIRRRFPNESQNARQRSRELRGALKNVPELLTEVELLTAEGELEEARSYLVKARKLIPAGSTELFESMFTEEKLLRRERAGEQADELLLKIAAEAPAELAARALFQSAKNSWNENNQVKALELLDQIESRFKDSSMLKESRYIEGRILEELQRFREAEGAYLRAAEALSGPLEKSRSLKRALWLRYLRREFDGALKLADQLLALPTKSQDPKALNDLFQERSAAIYWKGRVLQELGRKDEAAKLFNELPERDRRGYYGTLARRQLKNRVPYLESPKSCTSPEEIDGVSQAASPLSFLPILAQREIDYRFSRIRPDGKDETLVELLAAQAGWSERLGLPSSQIELAEEALRLIRLNGVQSECDATLARLAFPRPHLELYKRQSAKVALPILLAISRTESHFKEDALSRAGAQGLMQLMPETAKREGWDGVSPLTDPAVNISLGAKHLARLFREYDGSLVRVAAAYNAGSSAVNRWLSRYETFPEELFVEFIGYPETNKYVRKVVAASAVYEELMQ
jgi:tetratricopeptide (TPR) repeat protein